MSGISKTASAVSGKETMVKQRWRPGQVRPGTRKDVSMRESSRPTRRRKMPLSLTRRQLWSRLHEAADLKVLPLRPRRQTRPFRARHLAPYMFPPSPRLFWRIINPVLLTSLLLWLPREYLPRHLWPLLHRLRTYSHSRPWMATLWILIGITKPPQLCSCSQTIDVVSVQLLHRPTPKRSTDLENGRRA